MERKRSVTAVFTLFAAIFIGGWSGGAVAKNSGGSSLQDAVLAGKDIRVVDDLSLCTEHGTGSPGPAVRGSLHPDAFMVLKDGTVAFSSTHFTVHPDGKPVQEFLKFRVLPDEKVEFQTTTLDPANFSIMQKKQYDCTVGKGVTFAW